MTDNDDVSSAILVPFDGKWEQSIISNKISVFFRKRGPKTFTPQSVFLYIASPRSCLVGRSTIHSFAFMPVGHAAKLAPLGGLTDTELRFYANRYSELAVFQIKQFEPAPTPLTFLQLAGDFGFHPPQSFVRLSGSGMQTLNKSLGYS